MRRYLLPAAIAAVVFSAGAASADDAFISIMGGPTFAPALSVDGAKAGMDNGFNGGLRVGYGLDDWNLSGFTIDADGFFDQSHYSGSFARLRSASFMGDLMYHLNTGTPFGIYGGAGLGAVNTNYESPTAGGSSTVFGWQAIGGVEYKFSPQTSLFTEYRYQNAHDANTAVPGVGNTSNNLSVGVKFNL
jgi:opacity protein-like surface antigen